MSADAVSEKPLVYVYGFVEIHPAAKAPASADAEGIASAYPVRMVPAGDIAAIVSDVPASEFGAAHLAANLNEMRWLERTARAHTRVLTHVLTQTTVLPARLATVYESDSDVVDGIVRDREDMEETFSRIRNAREWGVKLRVEEGGPRESVEAARAEPREADSPLSPGAAYLVRRRTERDVEESARLEIESAAADVHEVLRREAADARLVATRAELPGAGRERLALSAAYLVARDREPEFHAAVARVEASLASRGLAVLTSGPWPPYNFVEAPAR